VRFAPVSGFAAVLLAAMPVAAASAQTRSADSLAVVQVVVRFHEALAAGDTATLRGMLAPGAVLLSRGTLSVLSTDRLAAEIRWARAINRKAMPVLVRINGSAAFAIHGAQIEARAAADLINGTEIELIVLGRAATGWLIEAIHHSTGSSG
jgi:hypothetical protein